jgi:quinol monooxygenase YgiN
MATPGLVVFARLKANVGWEGHVRMALLEAIPPTLLEEGNIGYALHETPTDPRLFLLYEQWTDKAAFDLHMQLPHFKELAERLKDALSAPLEIIETRMISGAVAPAAAGP